MTRALAIVAAVLLTTSLAAQQQQRAPGSDSITQADLKADLFFVAGDAMRGRLTDTNENRVKNFISESRKQSQHFIIGKVQPTVAS